jgi:WD40 repeat protein
VRLKTGTLGFRMNFEEDVKNATRSATDLSIIPARVFISYSRKDGGEAFAASLRRRLLSQNLSVWHDIVSLEGGRDWWSQIEETLKSPALEHFVLVVTPASLESAVIRREIRLARQEGKAISPIRGPGIVDPSKLPRWIGQVYDISLPEHLNRLLAVLVSHGRQPRVPMMAPEPPGDFVERPVEFNAIKIKLLDTKGGAVAISAALRGAGGYGKTTLAKALAHDADIQDAYFDGVLWVELGERPDNLLGIITDLITRLTGTPPGLATVNAAAAALGEALGNRRILLVIDDVWREQDLRPFLQGGRNTTRLVTTRLNRVIPVGAFRQPVDAMTSNEARSLLSRGLPDDQVSSQSSQIYALAMRLGKWAQLLKLVNGFLRERVIDGREFLSVALLDANARLGDEGLVAFDADDEADRTQAVARTINLSLGLLNDTQRARFAELAAFPDDVDIPLGVVAKLWQTTGGLSEQGTKDLLVKFYGLSLLLGLDLAERTLRFHDTILHYLQAQAGEDRLIAGHQRLISTLDAAVLSPETDMATRRYYYLYLLDHLAAAKERERVDTLLLNPCWLSAKLAATGRPQSLIADYDRYGAGEARQLIGRTLRLISGICLRDPRQLMPQFIGRLMDCGNPDVAAFLDAARVKLSPSTLLVQRPTLTPPGSESARFEAHSQWVSALCPLPDGRLASGSGDGTIRLWDVHTGAEYASLKGHSSAVTSMCILPDGRLASSSLDQTIRLWDVATSAESGRLVGHTAAVTALCVLPDGRLATGSEDGTIRIWDVTTRKGSVLCDRLPYRVLALCVLSDGRIASTSLDGSILLWDITTRSAVARFEGHSGPINVLCALPDHRIASGSDDTTIRLWDCTTGREIRRLLGHSYQITAFCMLPDGRLASGSWDDTIRLWNLTSGEEVARIEGHSGTVAALCVLSDGRLASGSWDDTIRLWEVKTVPKRTVLGRHSDNVTALCMLRDGRLASGSGDATIRLWDVTTAAETARFKKQPGWVTALCVLPDGRLASAAWDQTIRLWDVASGTESGCLQGHQGRISSLCVLSGGQLASGSWDNTIRLWDVVKATQIDCLKGHTDSVNTICLLQDGRLASGSDDHTIRLWHVATATETACLLGHQARVSSICALPDGRLASASWDQTIRLWDVAGVMQTGRLDGNAYQVTGICAVDGKLASGSRDNTVRLWDLKTDAEIARLDIDAPVQCLIALPDGRLVVGDDLGWLHWLEIVR